MIHPNLVSISSSLPPPSSSANPLLRIACPIFRLRFSCSPLLTGARRSSCGGLRVGRGGSSSSGDGNAESIRAERFKFRDGGGGGDEDEKDSWRSEKRRWWSEEADEDFEAYDDDPFEQDPWDMIWIFKVFKSYGYFLPAIIASMLLATGPKAFLMALALPLGQSAISLAIDKMWGKEQEVPRRKPKPRKTQFTGSNWNYNYKRRWQDQRSYDQGRNGYQSWATDASDGNKAKASGSRLGGWDELDWQGGSSNGSVRQPPPTPNGSPQSDTMKKGKLSKRGRYKDTPLFLRLLVAVFPFLASWTRLFW
ncbi:hypothetical protein Cni_G13910 [Canna indica]|uniref:Uncharacterized protein n=1 Tax=Canna indica TaxID=4628 RepID=A0AAQ3KAR4_9LILI|nr:hypothetical protein Cni_G13910 [Canna indica]